MAVPRTRNVFAGKRPYLFVVFSKRSENVLFSFFLHKTTRRYSYRKIFAVLSIILKLQKRGTKFSGNDHRHCRYHYHCHCHRHCHYHYHYHLIINLISSYLAVMDKTKRKQISNTQINFAHKQTYLAIEMTSSGRCAYARQILSKKATKIVFTIKRLLLSKFALNSVNKH